MNVQLGLGLGLKLLVLCLKLRLESFKVHWQLEEKTLCRNLTGSSASISAPLIVLVPLFIPFNHCSTQRDLPRTYTSDNGLWPPTFVLCHLPLGHCGLTFSMANLDYPLFPIFAFFGFFLPLIPLPWHFQAWNSGTCFYIFWASLSCLNQFVNSLIWRGNVINSAPVWCEISIRITMATTVALPAASFCIVRRLYGIAAIRSASISYAQKRRAVIIDSLICGLWPLVYVALQYIVQGHRFNIYEDIGCMPALYNTIPTYFITFSWVLLFGIGSAVYCVLSLYAFAQRRLEFAQFMSTNKTLSFGRYFRLMALAMTEMICTVPLTILLIWLSATQSPVQPWISLANTHLDYSRVDQYPSVIYNANPLFVLGILFTRWASVACALIFFAFFGFAEEARRHYVLWYRAILRFAGIKSSESTNHVSLKADPPFKMIPTSLLPKHDSPSAEPFYPPPPAYTRGSLSISPSKSSVSDFSSTICPSPASQDYFKSLDGDVLFGHAV